MNLQTKTAAVLILSLFLTGITSAAYYQISFRGMKADQTQIQAGNEVNFETNIANLGENPRTDITVEALLVRDSDNSVVHREVINDDVDLAGREILLLDETVQVPSSTPEGDYNLVIRGLDSSGIAKAFVSEDISVSNDRSISSLSFGNKGVYLLTPRIVTGEGYTRRYSLPSYGTQGENVLPGSNFSIKFSLENKGTETVNPEARFRIVPTYSQNPEPVKEFSQDLSAIGPAETANYSFEQQLTTPGTYQVYAEIFDGEGNEMASSRVRLVIAGAGGSITDVSNSQDTYAAGQEFSLDATLVGPADGSTTVRDAQLAVQVTSEGSEVFTETKTIDKLPLSPQDYTVSRQLQQNLENYSINVTLGKDDRIYDTYTADYEPLTAERSLTEGGQVRNRNACFDDGKCTEREFEIGNCYDCIGVSEARFENNQSQTPDQDEGGANLPLAIIIPIVVLVLGGALYWRWNQ